MTIELTLTNIIISRYIRQSVGIWRNLRVGVGEPLPGITKDNYYLMWKKLTQKKIDVLIETNNQYIIIEVKERASLSGIGQLLSYKTLFEIDFRPTKPVVLLYVADHFMQDVFTVCNAHNITCLPIPLNQI